MAVARLWHLGAPAAPLHHAMERWVGDGRAAHRRRRRRRTSSCRLKRRITAASSSAGRLVAPSTRMWCVASAGSSPSQCCMNSVFRLVVASWSPSLRRPSSASTCAQMQVQLTAAALHAASTVSDERRHGQVTGGSGRTTSSIKMIVGATFRATLKRAATSRDVSPYLQQGWHQLHVMRHSGMQYGAVSETLSAD